MLKFLYLTQEFSSHEIFGNIVREGLWSLRFLPVYRRNLEVRKPKRKRGYDDKGSQRPKDKWLPTFDFSFTEVQNEKEKKSDLRQTTLLRILKYLENYDLES
jgi:hypothetical protein